MYYDFGVNLSKKFHFTDYKEYSFIYLIGTLLPPGLKIANSCRVQIREEIDLDDHHEKRTNGKSPKAIGFMEVWRKDDVLRIYCSIPARSFQNILIALSSNQIRHASIFGTKLKWRQGDVFGITLSTYSEEY